MKIKIRPLSAYVYMTYFLAAAMLKLRKNHIYNGENK